MQNNIFILGKIEKLFISGLTHEMSACKKLCKDADCCKHSSLLDITTLYWT